MRLQKFTTAIITLATSMAFANQPKLILQITVDQLRGDLPDKFMTNMGDGEFR